MRFRFSSTVVDSAAASACPLHGSVPEKRGHGTLGRVVFSELKMFNHHPPTALTPVITLACPLGNTGDPSGRPNVALVTVVSGNPHGGEVRRLRLLCPPLNRRKTWQPSEVTAQSVETAPPERHLHLGTPADRPATPGYIWDCRVLLRLSCPGVASDVLT